MRGMEKEGWGEGGQNSGRMMLSSLLCFTKKVFRFFTLSFSNYSFQMTSVTIVLLSIVLLITNMSKYT